MLCSNTASLTNMAGIAFSPLTTLDPPTALSKHFPLASHLAIIYFQCESLICFVHFVPAIQSVQLWHIVHPVFASSSPTSPVMSARPSPAGAKDGFIYYLFCRCSSLYALRRTLTEQSQRAHDTLHGRVFCVQKMNPQRGFINVKT